MIKKIIKLDDVKALRNKRRADLIYVLENGIIVVVESTKGNMKTDDIDKIQATFEHIKNGYIKNDLLNVKNIRELKGIIHAKKSDLMVLKLAIKDGITAVKREDEPNKELNKLQH